MEYRCFQDTFFIRLDPSEEILESLEAFAEKEQIALAEISGIGALKELDICVYDTAEKVYHNNHYEEAMELLSLSGTLTQKDGTPYLHLHAAAGMGNGEAVGGHLKRAVISATGEIVLRVIPGKVDRKFSEAVGLNLFQFEHK